jgi:hypothetical protein
MRCLWLVPGLILLATPAGAESGDAASPSPAALQRQGSPDFLFGRPRGSVGIRGSWTIPRAESDWYTLVTRELTVDRSDFHTAGLAADVGVGITPRLDGVFTVEYGGRTKPSEYRNYAENGLPILQSTRLRQAALSGGVRFALTPPGRDISSLAWIPSRWVPYVGAGGGLLYYEIVQKGDFVDIQDLSIFTDVFESHGWAPMAYMNGGVGIQIVRRLYLTVDARYQWAEADLNGTWINFEPLDLTGVRLSTGINVLF